MSQSYGEIYPSQIGGLIQLLIGICRSFSVRHEKDRLLDDSQSMNNGGNNGNRLLSHPSPKNCKTFLVLCGLYSLCTTLNCLWHDNNQHYTSSETILQPSLLTLSNWNMASICASSSRFSSPSLERITASHSSKSATISP